MNIFETIDARRITPSTEVQAHQFLFKWNDIPCFARGEVVALTGKAKSGKTYVCSLLMALAVKPQIMGIQRIQDDPLKVLWIDTEQSADSTHEILSLRIGKLIGQEVPDEQYFVYNFRQDNWQDRLSLVLACISKHQPDLVIFDGIRDVVGDINNYQEAQTVLGKMLSIASWSNACIVCVLHQNKSLEDKTLRGALGTELQNKSFETYECQKDPDTRIFSMHQVATRKYDITQKLEFTVDSDGLPVMEARGDDAIRREANYPEINPDFINEKGELLIAKVFQASLAAGERVRAKELETRVMQLTNLISFKRYNNLREEAINRGIIIRHQLEYGAEYSLAITPENSEGMETLF